jgi:hypothetical protein
MIHAAAFKQLCTVAKQLIAPLVIHALRYAVIVAQAADTAIAFQAL